MNPIWFGLREVFPNGGSRGLKIRYHASTSGCAPRLFPLCR
jgi:hypothetical protein